MRYDGPVLNKQWEGAIQMEKIKVAVLFGGQSTEHAVSLQSACAVLHAMKGTRFEAVPVGITREGRWFWYRGPLDLSLIHI